MLNLKMAINFLFILLINGLMLIIGHLIGE